MVSEPVAGTRNDPTTVVLKAAEIVEGTTVPKLRLGGVATSDGPGVAVTKAATELSPAPEQLTTAL
jgi:hypothetical protein